MLIKQGKTNIKYLLVVIILAAIVSGGVFYCYLNLPKYESLPIKFPQKTEKKTEEETTDWKIYINEKYGFEFKYPPIPLGCEYCKIQESDEGFSVNRTFLTIEDLAGLTLSEYAYKEFPEALEEGPKYETTNGGQYLEETWIESRENITVGGKEAITINYRFGGMGRFGSTTFVKGNEKVFIFDFTAGGFCCSPEVDRIYEIEVYEAMISTFRFLE